MPYLSPEKLDQWDQWIRASDWYVFFQHDFEQIEQYMKEHPEERPAIENEIYDFFEAALHDGRVRLLENDGPIHDMDRKPIDMAVIHHTGRDPGITWERLSAMHLLRLYVPVYLKERFGQPIWSNHFRYRDDGKRQMVFYGYHHLIRVDGKSEMLLSPTHIGWHAGNWDVNCRSLAICLDGDFSRTEPPEPMLTAVASILRRNADCIAPDAQHVKGHREVKTNGRTECPGKNFLGPKGWRQKILTLI